MKQNLTGKIGSILFVPVIGAVIVLAIFLYFLNQSSSNEAFINIAGYQRMLSEQMKAQVSMVLDQYKYEPHPGLHENVAQFDDSLSVLENGGKTLGRNLPSVPTGLMDELNDIKRVWARIKPELLKISDASSDDKDRWQIESLKDIKFNHLTSTSNSLLTAYEDRSRNIRKTLGNVLLGFLLLNMFIFVLGVRTIRHYLDQRKTSDAEIEFRVIQQAALAELGQHTLGKSSLAAKMDVAVGLVSGILKTEYCKVLEYEPESENFFLIAGEGWKEGLVGEAVISGGSESQAGYTLHSDEPVIVTNLREEARFSGSEILHDHDVISGVSVVICANSKKYGVLGVHTRSERLFIEDDINFLKVVSNILSQAIEQDRAERTLRNSEERFRNLVESTSDWVWETDAQGIYTYISPQIEDLLGYPLDEMLGKEGIDFMPPDEAIRMAEIFKDVVAKYKPFTALENINIHKNGQKVIFETSGVPFFDEHEKFCGYRGIGRDVSERKMSEEKLLNLAHYDQLTKLPNRALFFSQLQIALDKIDKMNGLVAIIFLDLDQFKLINDSLGHDTGDLLLMEVATRFTRAVRCDDTVARLGGDEFAFILADITNESDIKLVAQKILDTLNTPIILDGRELFITASIGTSCAPLDSENAKLMVTKADIAMFKAKEYGRNNIQSYTPRMDMKTIERLSLEARLRKALEKEEFKMFYQPKIYLSNGRISGMESLLRWQATPEKLISPVEFIPLLEDTGLIVPVGEWILYVSCKQTKKWHDAGYEKLRVSVNLSIRQFREEGLVKMVRRVLHNTGLAPEYLELEITESVLVESFDQTAIALNKLHDMGIHITIDDFGTGYSSLSYLKQFPISTLKIDRSFIKDTPDDSESAALTASIISMADSLHINVVAEGVETDEQVKFLSGLGCNEAQGYYYSRPVPVEDFTVLLEEDSLLKLISCNEKKTNSIHF